MIEIDELADKLNGIHTVSLDFRRDLESLMRPRNFKNQEILLKEGKAATKAWQILTGYIIAVKGNPLDPGAVKKIFKPGDIVTDLGSFYEDTTCEFTLIAIGNVKTLELKKKDYFSTLKKHRETDKLAQRIMIQDGLNAMKRADLILIQSANDRVKSFQKTNYVPDLPDVYSASFLGMTEESYLEEKCLLKAQGFSFPVPNQQANNNLADTAYQIKFYLNDNFASRGVCTIDHISKQIYTTPKTLIRATKKTFGITVHQLLIKLSMEHARKFLLEKRSIKAVAEATGYTDQATFSKAYKKYYGHPPKKTCERFNDQEL